MEGLKIERFGDGLMDVMTPTVVWTIFAVALIAFVAISIALTYHWKNYTLDSKSPKRIIRFYFLVSLGFILLMTVGVIAYTT